MQMAGFFIAAVVQGFVSDKFGRRTGLITFCLGGSLLFLLNGLLQTTNYILQTTNNKRETVDGQNIRSVKHNTSSPPLPP